MQLTQGGYCDVADKMIALLQKTGKIITTYSSIVADATSKIFTLALPELRTISIPDRWCILIHNPFVAEFTGDATKLANASKAMESLGTIM